MRRYTPKPGDVERTWHVIDATDVVLGRLATQIATLLRGKHKATFAPHVDGGDFVIVINAEKVALTGNKREQKLAYRHSGSPGGLRAIAYSDLLATHPERVVEKAVRGILPKTSLARTQMGKLKKSYSERVGVPVSSLRLIIILANHFLLFFTEKI